jgi:hypothetical protein
VENNNSNHQERASSKMEKHVDKQKNKFGNSTGANSDFRDSKQHIKHLKKSYSTKQQHVDKDKQQQEIQVMNNSANTVSFKKRISPGQQKDTICGGLKNGGNETSKKQTTTKSTNSDCNN